MKLATEQLEIILQALEAYSEIYAKSPVYLGMVVETERIVKEGYEAELERMED